MQRANAFITMAINLDEAFANELGRMIIESDNAFLYDIQEFDTEIHDTGTSQTPVLASL